MRTPIILVASALVLAGVLRSQDVIVQSNIAPVMFETTADTAAVPWPASILFPIPNPLPPTGFPLGDLAMENSYGVVIATNGFLISIMPNPAYPGPFLPIAPAPPIMGPLTGIAIDAAAATLWITDGAACAGVFPIPPYPIMSAPFLFGAMFPILAPPVTGLDWDPLTGSLWAVDVGGNVYNFLPGGLPIGPQPVMVSPVPGPAVDIAVARYPGGGVYVQHFGMAVHLPALTLSPTPAGIPIGTECGIAFHNLPNPLSPVPVGGACVSACGAVFAMPTVGVLGPSTIGNVGFGVTLSGATPGAVYTMVADLAIIPGAVGTCSFWIPPAPSNVVISALASPGGVVTIPISLAGLPPAFIGLTAYTQWTGPCIPVGPGQQIVIGAP